MTQANRVVPRGRARWLPTWLQQYRREQAIQDGIAGLVENLFFANSAAVLNRIEAERWP